MIDTLDALVHFGLITREQADEYNDAYWREVEESRKRLDVFVEEWLVAWKARTPWYKRWWDDYGFGGRKWRWEMRDDFLAAEEERDA